jgi:hypothetical protein
VKKLLVTSHQRLKILEVCAFFEAGGAFEHGIEANCNLNKRSDFPLSIRSWSVHGPFTGVGGFWKYFGGFFGVILASFSGSSIGLFASELAFSRILVNLDPLPT